MQAIREVKNVKDPVFYPEGYDRTFSEMSAEEKDRLSHRGMALKKLRDYLAAYLTHIEQ